MFTGIVEAAVPVLSLESNGTGARLVLPAPVLPPGGGDALHGAAEPWSVGLGDSVAVAGCCLTVAAFVEPSAQGAGAPAMAFDLSAETLGRTWFGEFVGQGARRRVNLERALRLGDRLGGHLVSGHVDGLGHLVDALDEGDGGRRLVFELERGLDRYLIDKGSITLDGVSLTVVEPQGRRFAVAAIPATLAVTTLGELRAGDRVHVEADLVGKWIERFASGGVDRRG